MKKSLLLLLPIAACALAGCNGSKSSKKKSGGGGSQGEADAIERAKSFDLATINGATALYEGEKVTIGWKNGVYTNDYICLTTEQTITDKDSGNKYIVNIDWEFNEEESFIKDSYKIDDTHKGVFFAYNAEKHDFAFKGTLSCGKATPVEMNFEVELQTKNLKFDPYTIEEIYKTTEADDNYELVDKSTGYYKSNNKPLVNYTCVSTQGKVLYVSPDGNWALIGDGDYTLQLYSGSALDLNTKRYPALTVGNTVYIEAELSCYYGNLQISFIFDISQGDSSKVKDSTGFKALNGSDFETAHYWQNKLMNSLRTVTAVYKGGIDQKGTAISDVEKLKNDRFTFNVEVGGVALTVSYDYHVDREDTLGIFSAFKNKLKSWSVGQSVTLKGTLRFAGTANTEGYKGNESVTKWQLVPYLTEHLG